MANFKKNYCFLVLGAFFGISLMDFHSLAWASRPRQSHRNSSGSSQSHSTVNPLFSFPHLLPSPLTLPAGRVVFGSSVGMGLTDFLQVSTDLFRDLYSVYNAQAKLGLYSDAFWALALTFGWQHYRFKDIDSSNPDGDVTSYQPGGVVAFAITPVFGMFLGGHADMSNIKINVDRITHTALQQGGQVEADLTYAYSLPEGDQSLKLISVGVNYDFLYKLTGFGLSHHWSGLQLGAHYYPKATSKAWYPIIIGGASFQI